MLEGSPTLPATSPSGLQLPRRLRSVFVVRAAVVLACIYLFYSVYPWPRAQRSTLCDQFPDPGNIAIAVKTGATEPKEKLLPLLRTSLQCASDVLVLSDIDDLRHQPPIHDVLRYFSPDVMRDNTDFDLYRRLQSLQAAGQELTLDNVAEDTGLPQDAARPAGKGAGWILDKYKFLHMVDAAWDLRPGRQWYLFLETDTYLSWPNFLRWLQDLDSGVPCYLGNAVQKDAEEGAQYFAQGGSGIVLSGGVVEEIATRKLMSRWDAQAHRWTFGDFMFADFLFHEMNLTVTNAGSGFNDFNSTTLPLTQSTWCEPVITLHRVASDSFDDLLQGEQRQSFTRFLRGDAFHASLGDDYRFPETLENWDNLSEAPEHRVPIAKYLNAHVSVGNCANACRSTRGCWQFIFRHTTSLDAQRMHECVLSSAVRLGHPKAAQDYGSVAHEAELARSWTSGWRSELIRRWIEEQGAC